MFFLLRDVFKMLIQCRKLYWWRILRVLLITILFDIRINLLISHNIQGKILIFHLRNIRQGTPSTILLLM